MVRQNEPTHLSIALRAAGLVVLWGSLHSLLASEWFQAQLTAVAGLRVRNGLYRTGFIVLTLVTLAALGIAIRRLPNRLLYRVPAPWIHVMRAAQGAAALFMLGALPGIGVKAFFGWPSLRAFIRGAMPPPEAPAQGPAPDPAGGLKVRGVYRYSRHPANFAVVPIFLLTPVMSARFFGAAVAFSLYALLASFHEDYRAGRALGPAYERYREMVPFFVPTRLPRD